MSEDKETKTYWNEIKTGTSDSILASLFRTILFDLGITATRFNILVEKYIIKAAIPKNVKDISTQRGNLKKELLKSTLTWKVFIKAMVFLNVMKIDIRIRLHHCSGTITEHHKTVVLDRHEDIINDKS